MITGNLPFEADTPMGVVVKQTTGQLPKPSLFVKGLPVSIETFLQKALAKDPTNRYADMAAFRREMSALSIEKATQDNLQKDTIRVERKEQINILVWLGLIITPLMLFAMVYISFIKPKPIPKPQLSQYEMVITSVAQTFATNPTIRYLTKTPASSTTQEVPLGVIAPPTSTPLPCNMALPVSETYPDGTNININTNFVKTWRIRNGGTCTWNTNYKAIFTGGTSMNGPATLNFTQIVHPGETYDIIMNLKAPAAPGSYKGTWHLYGDDNIDFTKNGIWVLINAINPTPVFKVSGVSFAVNPPVWVGPCPRTFTFTAGITTTAADTVTYKWTRSDGASAPMQTLVFAGPGTQYVTSTWTIGADYIGWKKIYIDVPNHQTFGTASFNLNCVP